MFLTLVPRVGFEPTSLLRDTVLNRARLPVSPPRLKDILPKKNPKVSQKGLPQDLLGL